jgi:hypothetical protein
MPLPWMDPAKLTLVRQPFDHPDFLFVLKHDGFRTLAYISDGHCELISRRRNSYKSFAELRTHLAGLKVKNAVIDGELVCLDARGSQYFHWTAPPSRQSNFLRVRFAVSERTRPPTTSTDRTEGKLCALIEKSALPDVWVGNMLKAGGVVCSTKSRGGIWRGQSRSVKREPIPLSVVG